MIKIRIEERKESKMIPKFCITRIMMLLIIKIEDWFGKENDGSIAFELMLGC